LVKYENVLTDSNNISNKWKENTTVSYYNFEATWVNDDRQTEVQTAAEYISELSSVVTKVCIRAELCCDKSMY
jgi:hypothetical protein